MQKLNFPEYSFRFKNSQNKLHIFDRIRKKFVVLQPEEWVRQHTLCYLIEVKGYPESLINIEKELTINNLKRRYDIVVFNTDGSIRLMVECKAPKVAITQAVFDQIARYNLVVDAEFLMVTNGLSHYYCKMDYEQEKYLFIREVPAYSS
ncbi:type I restriction enzyme HsdR N-terminal domain-containing protein [Robertkochia solimangrovi]|uniref:type I restriction enzyme HsdR N-terminal domain-containing protein n=1 Tax=Robertkochia solimangrovi TaxID=2213046 RepID=UPI00117DF992|nr:type I restriction enzyme HsdR N-terminal domain-containing protein [Robertkochia solimangrovi]TRZ45206.1 restriction endonuclease subunit R [Robertkochia solimangrovi]